MNRGFLPCFQHYQFTNYPIDDLYQDSVYVTRLEKLLTSLISIENPVMLKTQCGIGKEIQPIRPDSKESIKIINDVGIPYQLYRIDYGNNPFRVVFGIQNENRIAHIVIIDTKHKTMKCKRKK